MKKLLLLLALLPTIAYGAVTFPVNGGTGTSTKPTFGQLLMGNANGLYDLVSTSSLGISGGTGVSNAYASSTFPSFTYATNTYATQASLGLYVPYSYGTSTYYFASNPSGYITSSALTSYVPFTYASTTFASTSWVTSTFVPFTYASTTFASTSWVTSTFVPFSYATNTFATTTGLYSNFVPYLYATNTFATTSGLYTNFMRYTYASSTFPTFTYATTTFASTSWVTNTFVPYSYATNTFVTYAYGSSSYGGGGITNAYASSSFVKVIDDQTVTGEKTFNGTTTLATTTHRSAVRDSVNSAGSSGQVLQSTGTSTLWVTNSASGISGSGINGMVARFSDATTLTTGTVIDNGTVAGVNATTSTATFNVQASGGVSPLRLASSSGSMMLQMGVNGSLVFATTTNGATTTLAEGITLEGQNITGALNIFRARTTSLRNFAFGNDHWAANKVWYSPGIVAAGLWQNAVGTNAGSAALVSPTVTANSYTALRRTTFATVVTTNNQQVGTRTAAEYFRGDGGTQIPAVSNRIGGFFYYIRFGFTTWTNGDDLFVGLSTCTTACITGTTTLTNLTNTIGLGVERGNNNLVFLTNDASGVISTTTLATTPATNQYFDFYMYQVPNDHTVYYRLDNASTSAIIAVGSVSSNLPATTTLMTAQAVMGNGLNTTVGAATIGISRIYIETEK